MQVKSQKIQRLERENLSNENHVSFPRKREPSFLSALDTRFRGYDKDIIIF
jgi:hypothetical protein